MEQMDTLQKSGICQIHWLPHHAWNVACKQQKNYKRKILSFVWMVKKMVQKMGCLLELSSDARKYVVDKERIMEPLGSGKMLNDKIQILHCKHQSWMLGSI